MADDLMPKVGGQACLPEWGYASSPLQPGLQFLDLHITALSLQHCCSPAQVGACFCVEKVVGHDGVCLSMATMPHAAAFTMT